MKTFLGDQYQTPPMFSAKKIDGVPLYKMARKGKLLKGNRGLFGLISLV